MTVAAVNGSVGAVTSSSSQEIDKPRQPHDAGELDKMARQFEAIFVRRMLERTSIANLLRIPRFKRWLSMPWPTP